MLCDAYCRVLSLEIEDTALYTDEKGRLRNPDRLCLAARGAVWDAVQKIHQLKLAEKSRIGTAPAGAQPDSMTDCLTLRPHPFEAILGTHECPPPSLFGATGSRSSQRSVSEVPAGLHGPRSTPAFSAVIPSWMRAAHAEGTSGIGGTASSLNKHMISVMLAAEDESRCVELQRQAMAREERNFWQRVDVIRKAQRNTIKNLDTRKTYKDFDYAAQNREGGPGKNANIAVRHVS